jgi:PadR family transcriptional regulator, regulatory protein PadR
MSQAVRSKLDVLIPHLVRLGMEGEILKGHLDMVVLAALAARPAHGYGIIQEIRGRSGGAFDLPEGTIYPVLHRLEEAGFLSSRWTDGKTGRKRRVYSLTRRGSRALADRRALWGRFADAIGGFLGKTDDAATQSSR